ncbi:MAG: fimbrillin family protein [Rikenellaceae bacterium]|nr:fimbrillin family protein [Rikenellaceae bacterium]
MFLISCRHDQPDMGSGDALRVNVMAKGFSSGGSGTRTAESGYLTTFTAGDRIGVTVILDGQTILEDNIPYEYDGSEWQPADPTIAAHRYPGSISALVYYPYDAAMDGKTTETEMFAAFTPGTDQSAPEDYAASDLMTGVGALSGPALNVTLTHALAMVEITLAAGSTEATLKIDEGAELKACNISGAKWRCIVKPSETQVALSGRYTLGGVLQQWRMEEVVLEAGKYVPVGVVNSFYTGGVTVNYSDGTNETVQYDHTTGNIPFTQTGKTIGSVGLPDAGGVTYPIGRDTSAPLALNLHGSGAVMLRQAGQNGFIPIGSYAEFQLINSTEETLAGKYRQEIDLDLTDELWTPVGSASDPFTGNYDGDGHAIANLNVNAPASDCVGLFGYMSGDNALIGNVHILSGSVKGNADVGAVCGRCNYGTISGCYNAATVEASDNHAGGIAGYCRTGMVIACRNDGTVVGADQTGGVVGFGVTASIIACCNGGEVSGGGSVGGVVGYNFEGGVGACYNTGPVDGNDCVGGITGVNDIESLVTACYNTGTVSATIDAGGIVGVNFGSITTCYWLQGTAALGVNNSTRDEYTGADTDVVDFTLPPGFTPDSATYPQWVVGTGTQINENGDVDGYWANYTGNGGLPQLWWQ